MDNGRIIGLRNSRWKGEPGSGGVSCGAHHSDLIRHDTQFGDSCWGLAEINVETNYPSTSLSGRRRASKFGSVKTK